MKQIVPLFVAPLLLFVAIARADLDSEIKAILQDPYLKKAEVGIQIVRLGTKAEDSAVVYKHNSDIPLIPASNLKLVTTAAAVDRFGADFKYRTMLVKHGEDLHIVGDGDPSFGDVQMLKKVNWDVTTVFAAWADVLKKQNIAAVRRVVVDDGIFDRTFNHPSWTEYPFAEAYVAPVAGFNLNCNCVDVLVRAAGGRAQVILNPPTKYMTISSTCVAGASNDARVGRKAGTNELFVTGTVKETVEAGQVTVEDPPAYAATVFAEVLAGAGIKVISAGADVGARAAVAAKDPAWTVLAVHETPLATVVSRANKDSKNMYAEALCKRLGFAAGGQAGSWTNGTAAVGEYLKGLGVPAEEYRLDDGSGLSKKNLVSTNGIIAALRQQYHAKSKDIYLESLSVAGMDGTLKTRFRNSRLQKRVFGKSGYVSGVGTLSGYVQCSDDRVYAFSILMNGLAAGTNNKAHEMQEKIIKALDANTGPGAATR